MPVKNKHKRANQLDGSTGVDMLNQLKDFVVGIKKDPEVTRIDETSIKQTIIMKVLHLLGWDTFNRKEVVLEYGVDTKKVDIALFCNAKCLVLLEAKNGSEDLDRHQEQLLNYAFRKGVELAVLTNGLAWWFYLPTKSVDWRSRKFYAIDLLRQDPSDIVNRFSALLGKGVVSNGDALRHAEQMYESGRKKLLTDAYLPKAWNKIVEDPDSLLVELISESTESLCGYKPDASEVTTFLKNHASTLRISEDLPLARVPLQAVHERTPVQVPLAPDASFNGHNQKRDHDGPGERAAYEAVKRKIGNLGERLPRTRNWFRLPKDGILILRYSKAHGDAEYDQYFFGLQRDKVEGLGNQKLFMALICGSPEQVLVFPADMVTDLFHGVRTAESDDNWKFNVFVRNGNFEIAMSGKQRQDVSRWLNKYELLRQ